MFYFKTSAVFFSVATLSTFLGIAYLEFSTGLNPQMQIYDQQSKAWYPCYEAPVDGKAPVPITHFHVLLISTCVMLAIYFIPMLLRPIDFALNFPKYIIGWITYMFMMPIFVTVMNIYAMCNLHDISWGNRPAATDAA